MADIQKLKELGELRDEGILTQDEFEKEKNRILNSGNPPPSSGSPPSYNETVHTKQTQYNSPPPITYGSDQPNNTPWIIGGVIAFVILLIIILEAPNLFKAIIIAGATPPAPKINTFLFFTL